MKKLKCWAISDTHTDHYLLDIPKDIDIVIAGGDYSNPYNLDINTVEVVEFLNWFSDLPIKYKIFIAGNHDSSIYHGWVNPREWKDLIYLENSGVEIEGIKIWGSPFTPTFGNWAFMKSREKLGQMWENIPSDTDILVTHGPPKGILDLSENRNCELEFCGDSALFKATQKIKPKYHIFGHIHNTRSINNQGIRIFNDVTYINASCVTDGRFGSLSSNGLIFEI